MFHIWSQKSFLQFIPAKISSVYTVVTACHMSFTTDIQQSLSKIGGYWNSRANNQNNSAERRNALDCHMNIIVTKL